MRPNRLRTSGADPFKENVISLSAIFVMNAILVITHLLPRILLGAPTVFKVRPSSKVVFSDLIFYLFLIGTDSLKYFSNNLETFGKKLVFLSTK